MNNEEMKNKLKEFFMSDLGVDGSVLNFDTPLFGDEIGLDSVDSLEIISFVDENFGVSMTGVGKDPFQSIDTIAAFIESHKA
ncbi:MAG: phosphopantetheine-binding protein [Fibrobacter sp.]|nr:phosphopantetheine-binding protein [Fibrobacter sp.]